MISQEIVASLPTLAQRTLSRVVRAAASGWLTVLPLRQEGYDLTSTQFRDQLAIRYGHQPGRLPSLCDGCGVSFTLQHALDCPKGGLIKRGHNDIRDHDAKLADLAWGGVVVEPVLVPADDRNSRPALQADWSARGVWEGNRVALFDNRIVDANAPVTSDHRGMPSPGRQQKQRRGSTLAPARTCAARLRHWFVPQMPSSIGSTPRTRNAWQAALPQSGISLTLLSWRGSGYRPNLPLFGLSTSASAEHGAALWA